MNNEEIRVGTIGVMDAKYVWDGGVKKQEGGFPLEYKVEK